MSVGVCMKSRLAALVLTGLSAFAFAMIATSAKTDAGKGACGPRANIMTHLSEQLRQTRRGFGLIRHQFLMELFAADNGSWTITVSNTRNETCVMAAGSSLHLVNMAAGQDALLPTAAIRSLSHSISDCGANMPCHEPTSHAQQSPNEP